MLTVAMAVKQTLYIVYMAVECQAGQGNKQTLVFRLSLSCSDYAIRLVGVVQIEFDWTFGGRGLCEIVTQQMGSVFVQSLVGFLVLCSVLVLALHFGHHCLEAM
jgi:hypothetical protein